MQFEVVVTGQTCWWLCLLNWFGADMKWTHALLRYCEVDEGTGWIIEAAPGGVIRRRWNPADFESYARFKLKDSLFASEQERWLAFNRMVSFAQGEIGKRYKYEALGLILRRILRKIPWRFGIRFIGTGEVCTSLVDRTLMYEGFDLVPDEDSPYVLPDEIANSRLLEMIEEVRG